MRIYARYRDTSNPNATRTGYLVNGVVVWVPEGTSGSTLKQMICDAIGLDYSTYSTLLTADSASIASIVSSINAAANVADIKAVLITLLKKIARIDAEV